jgi:hypothetical protein
MKPFPTTLGLLLLGLAGCGAHDAAPHAAAATPSRSAPVVIALKSAHHSGVTGTATLTPSFRDMTVTIKLGKRIPETLLTHIHTGPCSDEPTLDNPRIWANLNEVVDGRSETTVNVVTLRELQSEPASINVHDPAHGNRPLVCGDIPQIR